MGYAPRMKKILLGVFGFLALSLAGLLVAAVFQPDVTHVERSRVIRAASETIMPQLTDMKRWVEWSPWSAIDPNTTWTFSDPTSGKGAWYTWEGNDEVGKGRMEVTDVTADSVSYDLQFIEPFASEADVTMTLTPAAEGTKVVWSMDSENTFPSKVFMVFADFDAMIGGDFEKGLANLAERVEASNG